VSADGRGLQIKQLAKHFGGVRVFEDVTFDVPPRRVTALLGPNGAGKTTIINIICGIFPADHGEVYLGGQSLLGIQPHQTIERGIVRTFQDVRIFPSLTALENVLTAFPRQSGDRLWEVFLAAGRVAGEERKNRARAMELLDQVDLAAEANRPAEELPFGQQKLLGLVRAVATGAGLLLLDEPSTGVEVSLVPNVTRLIRYLVDEEARSVLLIEHNVDVVREIADQVVVLQGTVITSGTCDAVLNDERVIREYLGRLYDA
jgi:ABC-type branched-subunit amino acid transport system ATPase component